MATEEFKRPDHPDFATTSELRKMEFTGVREYKLTGNIEFWILGAIVREVTPIEIKMNPNAVTQAHLEVFAMDNSKPGVRR